jgi:hypothetical protein
MKFKALHITLGVSLMALSACELGGAAGPDKTRDIGTDSKPLTELKMGFGLTRTDVNIGLSTTASKVTWTRVVHRMDALSVTIRWNQPASMVTSKAAGQA